MSTDAHQLAQHWEALGRAYLNRRWLGALHESLPVKLSPGQLRAVVVLSEGGEPRLGELADRIGLEDSTVSRLVDRLEALGVVERRRGGSTGDRRAVGLGLTPLGDQVVEEVRRNRHGFASELLDALEPGERREFVRLFGVVAERLRN